MAGEKKFGDSVLQFIDKVAESGKKGFKAAGDKINDFGDKSVVRIELGQLKSKINKAYADLGKKIFEKIENEKVNEISFSDSMELAELLAAIRKIDEDIKKHEDLLEKNKKGKAEVIDDKKTEDVPLDSGSETSGEEA